MDDGTEEKYLSKIKEKYPSVRIVLSEFSADKVRKIRTHIDNGTPVSGLKLPSEFWKTTIEKFASDYFLLLEDDIWLQSSFNIFEAENVMKNHNMALLKLFYFGNERLISGEKNLISSQIAKVTPKLFTTNPFVFENILIKNPLKIISILYKLGIWDRFQKINYYTIYNVAGCIFYKNYYLYLWNEILEKVNEDKQLIRALKYFKEHNPSIGFTPKEILKTSFTSSATNMFADVDFDVYKYNKLLNESWYNNTLDVTKNYNTDINKKEIEKIVDESELSVVEWNKWQKKFVDQYINVGHKID